MTATFSNRQRKAYAMGCRNIHDLKTKFTQLTSDQRLGLKYFGDLQRKMTRKEVEQMRDLVLPAIHSIDPDFQLTVCGSYRRGAEMCGDCDLILTHPSVSNDEEILAKVVHKLRAQGIVKDCFHNAVRDNSHFFMGIVKLPGSEICRRIDILFVPIEEVGAAILHFTGNSIFNRCIRFLATKKGMKLNQKGLFFRSGDSVGECIAGATELEIFQKLGLDYWSPETRTKGFKVKKILK